MINITSAASEYIKKMIEKHHGVGFRLTVKKTGCSGYSYAPSVIENINPQDQILEIQPGITIYIDSAWLDLLNDVQVDYIEEDKSGLKQKRLVFINSKEGDRCGCGESFQIT
jgi:iron-sulfur cluster assembly protein